MRFAGCISDSTNSSDAVETLLGDVDIRMTRGMVDLAMLFVTKHFNDDLEEIIEGIQAGLPGATLLGCSAEGTIGANLELEQTPSISLLAASLPDVQVRPFRIDQTALNKMSTPLDWERSVAVSAGNQPTFLALADPFQFDIQTFVDGLNEAYPDAPLIGGIASSGRAPRENAVWVDGDIHRDGAVGVALSGFLAVDTVVSQGCRPIGKPFVITKSERNVIQELGGKSALKQLQEVILELSERDEALARKSLFVGRVIDEFQGEFSRGDFLLHNIIGADNESGSIGIAPPVRTGTTIQFQVRDAQSADEDLRLALAPYEHTPVEGAFLVGCNGRGSNMWKEPGHDVGVLRECAGQIPTAGFFAGGEFGPIRGRNYVHGFSASIALFREPDVT